MILELQLGVSRQAPRLMDPKLPPIINRRLLALDFNFRPVAAAAAGESSAFFAGSSGSRSTTDQTFVGSDFTGNTSATDGANSTSQLVNTALEEYRSRIIQEGISELLIPPYGNAPGVAYTNRLTSFSPSLARPVPFPLSCLHFVLGIESRISECILTTFSLPYSLHLCFHYSAVIASSVSTVCQQVKVLADFLVEIICLGVQSENVDSAKPAPPYAPSAVLQGLLAFCIKYRVVPLDRILLSLLLRSSQLTEEIAAVHSVFFFVFSQCSELRAAIKKISEVGSARAPTSNTAVQDGAKRRSLPCPSLISSSRWQDLLNYLHSIIPEQSVQLPGMDEPEIRQPRMPVYFDHLILRLLPILEIFFTSCLDHPPPLLQLARFCNIISPLMLLHHRPVNLSFILLRGQFQQFGSPVPISATLPKVLSSRKSNLIDKVCCQLIIRSLLHEHQQLAVCTNRALRRDCAMRFADLGVAGLFSPPAWNHLESVFDCAVAKAEARITSAAAAAATYSDADFAVCLRTTGQVTEHELHLAQEIDQSAGAWHPTADYMFALLSPIVASKYHPL
ncbi:unnamed protein product [Schistocephalus solidus]|uniref:Uncharacterized protein n=1 Tax=Schistocephalus solidus TaxID=70667 RepID=A0A3P7DN42_SCHSO|nr:unnamed protein product [Schistocephalus solidus]